jgi:hypothetical protein
MAGGAALKLVTPEDIKKAPDRPSSANLGIDPAKSHDKRRLAAYNQLSSSIFP